MRPAKTTLVTLFSEVARSLIGFFVTLYLAREVGAAVLGKFFIVIALLVWLKIPLNAIGSAIKKRVSEGESPAEFLGAGSLLFLLISGIIVAGIVLASGPLNSHIGAPVATLVAVLVLGNAFFHYVRNSLDGQRRVATSSVLKAAENVTEGGIQVLLVFLGYELVGLIAGQIVALFAGGVVGLVLFQTRPAFPGRDHIESLVEYARYSWLGTVSGRTFGWMDTLVLSFFVGSGLIGIYEISWRLASVLVLLSNAIQQTLFPEISNLAATGDEQKIRFFVDEGLFYSGLTAIPGLFGAAILGPKILRIYGPEFTAGGIVLLILILARLVDSFGSLLLKTINGLDRPDIAFRINGVFLISNLVLNVSFVYLFGWTGAAVATAVSAGITTVFALYALGRLIGDVILPWQGIGKQIAASVVMVVGVFLLRSAVPISNMYLTVLYVLIGATVYGSVLFVISSRVRNKIDSLLAEKRPA